MQVGEGSTVHRVFMVLAVGAAIGAVGSAVAGESATRPSVLTSWKGTVAGLAQDERGTVAWCGGRGGRWEIGVMSKDARSPRLSPTTFCPPPDWQWRYGEWSYVLEGGTVAYGGYEELRCVDTHWAVYEVVRSRDRRIALVSQNCNGYGINFRGLVSDGTTAFYGTVRYSGEDDTCDLDGICTFRLSGGGVYRLTAGRGVRIPGFPPAAEIAASHGRILTVEAKQGGTEDIYNGPSIGIPGAAVNGLVEVRRAGDGALISSFRPLGVVAALALSQHYAIVLVEDEGTMRINWYGSTTGRLLGTHPLPAKAVPRISASDRAVVFVVGKTIHALGLPAGSDRVLWRSSRPPVNPTIAGARVVWGETNGSSASILALTAP
jgi:hypothetical protein